MKWLIAITVILVAYISVYAQGYNAEWVLSYNTSLLNFTSTADTVELDTIAGNMPMFTTDANICDTNGNVLFFTNGIYVADKNGNMLENSDSLNPCAFTYSEFNSGLGIDQAAIFLPEPGSHRYYYLIHFSNDTIDTRPGTLYYSLIDVEGNAGSGAIVEKNVPFFKGAVLREGGLTACKHANGRDYWIVIAGHNNNTYYEFLLTPDSILGPYKQNFGPVYNSTYDWGYSKFSQDGTKYVTGCALGLVLIMDFDRCSGELSNPITLYHAAGTYNGRPASGARSEEFSPNGRFLYVTNSEDLTQYDLWSDTIQDSIQIWNDSASEFYQMSMLQIAPNSKIYGSTYSGGLYALHVINDPDLKGDSCGFVFGGQPTLTLNSS